jgi:hypothetical protein
MQPPQPPQRQRPIASTPQIRKIKQNVQQST